MSARGRCDDCGFTTLARTVAKAEANLRQHVCKPRGKTPRDTRTSCECGFTSRLTTSGLAADALRKHVCERTAIRRGIAERAAARRADPGVLRACTCKEAKHEHGTYVAFVVDRCTCRPCRDANAAYDRRRAREILYGRWEPYVDAQPAREHVAALRLQGMGLKTVARVSGVPHGSLSKLMYGAPERGMAPSKRIRPATAAKLLAVEVTVETLAGGAFVPAIGTHRRLQALVAIGWTQAELSRRLGLRPSNLGTLLRRARASAKTALAVRALFDELQLTGPPETTARQRARADQSRRYAESRRWPPPLWWDDDEIDDPARLVRYRPRRAA